MSGDFNHNFISNNQQFYVNKFIALFIFRTVYYFVTV